MHELVKVLISCKFLPYRGFLTIFLSVYFLVSSPQAFLILVTMLEPLGTG